MTIHCPLFFFLLELLAGAGWGLTAFPSTVYCFIIIFALVPEVSHHTFPGISSDKLILLSTTGVSSFLILGSSVVLQKGCSLVF
jgi:hypothetical protein